MRASLVYLSFQELDRLAAQRLEDAQRMHTGTGKQTVLKEVAELRSYAAMKRLISSPSLRPPQ